MNSQKNELVVKSNRLVEASYRLDTVEQRLILMAIVEARNTGKGISANDFLEVRAADFAELFDSDMKSAYAQLQAAADTLFNRWVLLHGIDEATGKPAERKMRWVSAVDYVEGAGLVRIQFAPLVVPYITRLESEFTSYRIGAVSKMTSSYAIRLYELLIQWGNIRQRVLTLDELKHIFQVDKEEYSRLFDLKKRVIDIAVNQINEHSDLIVSYTQRKVGRIVTHLIFKFEPKPVEKLAAPTPKASTLKLSKKEIERLARVGESYAEAEERILEERRKATI